MVFILTAGSRAATLDNWQLHSINPGGSLHSVVFGNGRYVAVGGRGRILTSPDGINWTVRNSGASSGSLNAVTYGNGTFVAVGYASPDPFDMEAVTRLILTSVDGISWNRTDTGLPGSLNGVTYGNGIFVAVGTGGWVLTSVDGGSTWNNARPAANSLYGITFASGKFVAVGASPSFSPGQPGWLNYYMTTSPNGLAWTPEIIHGLPEGSGLLSSVAFGKDTLVAVGSHAVLTSTNGGSWIVRDAGAYGLYSVAYGKGVFVAVGRAGKIVTSADGAVWVERNSGVSSQLSGVSYGERGFIVVASSGSGILQSVDQYQLSLSAEQSSTGTGTLFGAGVYNAAMNVQVTALPDANSVFVSWGGDCEILGAATSGMMTMDSHKSCTAIFALDPAVDHPVKKGLATYTKLQEAFDEVTAENEVIMHMSGVYNGQAVYRAVNAIILKGGYEQSFTDNAGSYTSIEGSLRIQGGALTIDNFVIR